MHGILILKGKKLTWHVTHTKNKSGYILLRYIVYFLLLRYIVYIYMDLRNCILSVCKNVTLAMAYLSGTLLYLKCFDKQNKYKKKISQKESLRGTV